MERQTTLGIMRERIVELCAANRRLSKASQTVLSTLPRTSRREEVAAVRELESAIAASVKLMPEIHKPNVVR